MDLLGCLDNEAEEEVELHRKQMTCLAVEDICMAIFYMLIYPLHYTSVSWLQPMGDKDYFI